MSDLDHIIGLWTGYIGHVLFFNLNGDSVQINQFKFGDTVLHIHHWLVNMILLVFVERLNTNEWLKDCSYQFLKGILVAGILHGIFEYEDWFHILY